jgi:hypothetical protein
MTGHHKTKDIANIKHWRTISIVKFHRSVSIFSLYLVFWILHILLSVYFLTMCWSHSTGLFNKEPSVLGNFLKLFNGLFLLLHFLSSLFQVSHFQSNPNTENLYFQIQRVSTDPAISQIFQMKDIKAQRPTCSLCHHISVGK